MIDNEQDANFEGESSLPESESSAETFDSAEFSASEEVTEESSNSEQQVAEEASEPESKPEKEETPFHEHPRFKQILEERNEARKQYDAMAERLERLEESNKPQPEQDKLISRLKEIDPEFGTRFEEIDQAKRELEELRQWRQQSEADRLRTQAETTLTKLHSENKVPEAFQAAYRAELESMARSNPRTQISDLPVMYKQVHEKYSKAIDNIKREERSKYVKDKRSNNVPTARRGQVPSSKKAEAKIPDNMDPREYLLRNIAKRSLSKYRSESDI